MVTEDLDIGALCERHVGELYRPRCPECDQARAESLVPAVGFFPGSSCAQHPAYPRPCARCARDASEKER